ncbi:MAG: tRNA preQ1(34) S-adenosylmethionine ribosyltransferase-isomerase QueA [Pseudomonadota bacterium]
MVADPDLTLEAYDFALPDAQIALRPAEPRSSARLLAVRGAAREDARVSDLPGLLRGGDLLVFNDTRVIPARLTGVRRRETPHGSGAARIEATLIERAGPDAWTAFAKPGRRLALGDRIDFDGLTAEVAAKEEQGRVALRFALSGAALDAAIAARGDAPLPPYIAARRAPDAEDKTRYQTVYAARDGAVAAPTAGLHFDAPLLEAVSAAGIAQAMVTLHVGAGTFAPVTVDDVARHRMHSERVEVGAAAAAAVRDARARGGRVIAVGTTSLRALEAAATAGGGAVAAFEGATDLFIYPGYRFQAVDGLMTNFHLPKSTLLMLVAALIGRDALLAHYAHAIAAGYRFYSYGDACLFLPDQAVSAQAG